MSTGTTARGSRARHVEESRIPERRAIAPLQTSSSPTLRCAPGHSLRERRRPRLDSPRRRLTPLDSGRPHAYPVLRTRYSPAPLRSLHDSRATSYHASSAQ
ncbi:hypothetical protein GY45DRAFT_1168314 [Cubamyces sp. BRFM 1775]|nr:hypothetical protein GY45DRAFT_1168314 [Cubamyces sp. BRFM 1775]